MVVHGGAFSNDSRSISRFDDGIEYPFEFDIFRAMNSPEDDFHIDVVHRTTSFGVKNTVESPNKRIFALTPQQSTSRSEDVKFKQPPLFSSTAALAEPLDNNREFKGHSHLLAHSSDSSSRKASSLSDQPDRVACGFIEVTESCLDEILAFLLEEQVDVLKQQLLSQLVEMRKLFASEFMSQSERQSNNGLSFASMARSSTDTQHMIEQELETMHILLVADCNLGLMMDKYPRLTEELLSSPATAKRKIEKALQLLLHTRFFDDFNQLDLWIKIRNSQRIRFQLRFSHFILPPTMPISSHANIPCEMPFVEVACLILEVFDPILISTSSESYFTNSNAHQYDTAATQVFTPCNYKAQMLFAIPFDNKTTQFPRASRRVVLYVTDELVNEIQCGDRCSCIGVLTTTPPPEADALMPNLKWGKGQHAVAELWLICNNITNWHAQAVHSAQEKKNSLLLHNYHKNESSESFYRGVCLSEWLLTDSMIASFGSKLLPRDCYMKLRLALLLSLLSFSHDESMYTFEDNMSNAAPMSCTTNDEAVIDLLSKKIHARMNVLIISDDVILRRFVTYAASLHPSYVLTGSPPPQSQKIYCEKGGLICFRHVTVMDTLDFMQRMSAVNGSTSSANTMNQAQNTIWSMALPIEGKKKLSSSVSFDEFDIICQVQDKVELEMDNNIVEQILQTGSLRTTSSLANVAETSELHQVNSIFADAAKLSTFIRQARLRSVTIEPSEQAIISKYFLRCRQYYSYPVSSLHTLVRVARAHARLHLRSTVQLVDVMVGIMMTEESMAVLGKSALQFRCLPNEKLNLFHSYDGSTSSEHMKNFIRSVFQFLDQGSL